MFKHILVPVDGGELSDKVVEQACAFAKETGAHLTFYHAKPGYYPSYMGGEVLMPDISIDQAFLSAMDKSAQNLLDEAARVAADTGVACKTLSNDCDSPYEGIVAAAESQGCDLIFMASHGRRGTSALLLGSETQKVLTHCKVPVLIYR